MLKRFGVLVAVIVVGHGSVAPHAVAQVPARNPQPRTVPTQSPTTPPRGVVVVPTIRPGQVPVQIPGQQPRIVPVPTTRPGTFPFVPQPMQPTRNVEETVEPQKRTVIHFTNGTKQDMTVFMKFVNTDGDVRSLKADLIPTLAPGEKATFTLSSDVATVRDKGELKHLVAFRGVRDDFPDTWWGVKVENGKVEDKNEFVGLHFTSFNTSKSGQQTKNLSYTLRTKNQ